MPFRIIALGGIDEAGLKVVGKAALQLGTSIPLKTMAIFHSLHFKSSNSETPKWFYDIPEAKADSITLVDINDIMFKFISRLRSQAI